MRRYLHGLDELAIETAFIGVSAIVFIVVLARALNSDAARQLEAVPVLGQAIGGVRALVDQVANP